MATYTRCESTLARSHVILFVCAVLTVVGPENSHKGVIDQWSKDMTLNLLRFWFFHIFLMIGSSLTEYEQSEQKS